MSQKRKFPRSFVLFSTIVVGMCSIIYELLISTVSSYFLGDSVKQFSIIIGVYMAFMGVGSWLSRYFNRNLIFNFVCIELILGIVGAFSVPLCYFYFAYADFTGFNLFIIFLVAIIGTLTGLEIPLLTKILEKDRHSEEGLSDVLTLDYLGALVATLIFPFILIPFMGVYKSSLLFGFINITIGVANFIVFRNEIKTALQKKRIYILISASVLLLVAFAYVRANQFLRQWNENLFKYPVVYEEASAYQNIVLTDNGDEFRLYLNGAIQFSSRDEYRYHEALVHVPAQNLRKIKQALILGGGEGLAARELLKYSEITQLDIVDLDPAVTKIASENQSFLELNNEALLDPKVKIYNEDAFRWLMENEQIYDIIIVDLPDPTNESLSKLYSTAFYNLVSNHLEPDGIMVTQATSPELSPKAFWSIEKSLQATDFEYIYPYQVSVPSFGTWGFMMASKTKLTPAINRSEIERKFVDSELLEHIFFFPSDIKQTREEAELSTLDRPTILEYYLEHWQALQSNSKK